MTQAPETAPDPLARTSERSPRSARANVLGAAALTIIGLFGYDTIAHVYADPKTPTILSDLCDQADQMLH